MASKKWHDPFLQLFFRSPWAIPGLWLLSLGLAGARQRSGGSLSIPIGLRAGIMASNFVIQTGGFLTCKPNFPMWVTGPHPFQPFSGISGLALSLLLAMVLHPREPNPSEEKHNDNSWMDVNSKFQESRQSWLQRIFCIFVATLSVIVHPTSTVNSWNACGK